ncbi:hypothetical protein COW36_14345 [bacterium (Candidatus Blackallbacteria) CG17_big_fil_post_rev_8_21_14_2_50_48_46]|uniref:protein O-GlcNAc transferase n=1 Tax=bacterium (Candidatus Blackallbacteria) CG17_big_fil_post_rev_8_21_14_2_50_48_46 TaxID=2014261 RepID=A0A2M7G316_9BACT|nr:MAG: hypothetical protein COW64_08870 [bacterium (Candidatus Blackallbacteria) CG18_big_fil_WC_8_21_14_2_50_49_26]PIW16141.1 MAG: hypothetical protein COW36_14345 [bacterium (Candidatus Blackallbacteria) CG17_big_fil_post_rev_8_21_14_2_50_48_46]PIW44228.1 MAG: hypothetical protein COW20_24675 [bacterium (Candidatus Blackallbacteria) CG13_big_fil_rev_8_21_14_2_50_49_14]
MVTDFSPEIQNLLEQAWALQQTGQSEQADLLYQQALENPLPPEPRQFALQQRGLLAQLKGQFSQAEHFLLQALELGKNADLLNILGAALRSQAKTSEALACFHAALEIEPEHFAVLNNLGNLYQKLGNWLSAFQLLLRAWELRPELESLEQNLAALLNRWLLSDQRDSLYQVLLQVDFENTSLACLHFAMGSLLRINGQPEKALKHHQKACELRPLNQDYQTGLRSLFLFLPDLEDAQRFQPFCDWGTALEAAVPVSRLSTLPDPERRLRIAYLSADFNLHSAGFIFLGLFQAHQQRDFDWIAYSNSERNDAWTERMRKCFGLWREVHDLSDEALADRIQMDKIDILVDLSGHTTGHRLEVFARKPAPIQIGGLGFGWTSGLKRMDYQFSDIWLVPPERAPFYSETVVYLPHLLHWQPPFTLVNAPLSDPPCLQSDGVTLGSGNEGFKLNQALIETWAEILERLPTGRLALKFRGLENPEFAKLLRSRFEALGLAPERLVLAGKTSHAEHVAWYRQIDLALDPFPYNGGVSTLEALWMGVPVISLAEGTRAGACILYPLGQPELVAQNREDYIRKVLALAQDRIRLVNYRQSLRQKLFASTLCDSRGYARAIEARYREVWRRWCAEQI